MLYFPPGTYLSGTLNVTSRTGLVLEGQGATLKWTGTGSTSVPIGLKVTGTCRDIQIRGLRFLGDGTAGNYHVGVWCTTAAVIENLRITACHFETLCVGCWLNRIGSGTWHGITISDCEFETTVGTSTTQGVGVYVHHESTVPLGLTIRNNVFDGTTKHCIHLERGTGIRVTENQSKSHRAAPTGAVVPAIQVQRCTDVIVARNHLHEYADGGISVTPTGGVTVTRILITENVLTNPVNAIQDINLGTADPATDGGVDQVQVTHNIIRKSAMDVRAILVQAALRSRVAGNQVTMLLAGATVSAITLSASGDSGGARAYTDDLVVADNLLYGTVGAGTFTGIELGAGFCTSTARAEFRGNRVRGGNMFVSGATITNDQNLQVVDQPDDGMTYDTGVELVMTETGPMRRLGAIEGRFRTVTTSPYTADDTDEFILCDVSSINITINLPTAVGRGGRRITVMRGDSTVASTIVTIDPSGAQTASKQSTWVLYVDWETVTLVSNGANWQVIAGFAQPSRGQVVTVSGTFQATAFDRFFRCDSSGGAYSITLPPVAEVPGKVLRFTRIDTTNTVTLDGAGAETIDGAATLALAGGGGTTRNWVEIVSSGVTWYTIGRNF